MTSERVGVVVSAADEASVHVGRHLRDLVEWTEHLDEERRAGAGGGVSYRRPGIEVRTIEGRHLETDGIAAAFDDPRLIVFASRHAGETGPLLTAHHTGNFGTAEYGGTDRSLARAAPNAHRRVLAALDRNAPEGYDVGTECTHHGPTHVGAPSLFVEVGSGPDEWDDADAAEAVARAILALTDVPADAPLENGTRRHLVGFGGGHYAPRFERIARETDWSIGHVAADWCLDEMGAIDDSTDVVHAAFAESAAECALLAGDRPALVDEIERLGYRVVDETWVRETSEVPLALVDELEAAIAPVDAGLRFGAPARDGGSAGKSTNGTIEYVTGSIPGKLVSTVNAVDQDATRQAVDAVALGYATEHGGSRVTGPVALARTDDEDRLVDGLANVLRQGYDGVDRRDDAIVVSRSEFDPDLARSAGVSPGPDFGRLADGEPVTVGGTEVTPEEVTVERERELPVSILAP